MKFLEFVTREIYSRYADRMQDITLVFPTRRAGTFVKDILSELIGDKPVCAPECTTISDLFNDLCPYSQVDELEVVCRLYNIFTQYEGLLKTNVEDKTMSLDCFYGWGRQLMSDFNNIDMNYRDVDAEIILSNATEAHKFDKPLADPEVKDRICELMGVDKLENSDSFMSHFHLLWDKLPEIYAQLNKELLEQKQMLGGARYKWVVQNYDEPEVQALLNERTYVFCGFNILQATELKLMELLQKDGKALFIWDFNTELCNNEPHIHAYDAIEKLRSGVFAKNSIWPGAENANIKVEEEGQAEIKIISAPSNNAQARYAHKWLLAHNNTAETAAVVLCDENMQEPVIYSIPGNLNEQVNITKGLPLRNTHPYALIEAWLKDADNLKVGKDAVDMSKPHAIEADIIARLISYVDDFLAQEYEERMGSASVDWHVLLFEEAAYQARCAINSFAKIFSTNLIKQELESNMLRNLLMRHLSAVTIPFHGEPATRLQLIGVLETRTLDFDHVLLLNVEDGVLPQRSADNSFIPYYLRLYYRLTTNEDQGRVYAYNFFRLLHRAKSVSIVFSEAEGSMGQKTMSPFVMQILAGSKFNFKRMQICERAEVESVAEEAQIHAAILNLLPRENNQPLYSNYLQKLQYALTNPDPEQRKSPSLSPSAINVFLSCKMKFFLQYMLDLREQETSDYLLQANELGTLIHGSEQCFYENILGGRGKTGVVSKARIEQELKSNNKVEQAIAQSYKDMNDSYRFYNNLPADAPDFYSKDEHVAENRIVESQLKNILDYDIHCGGIDIRGMELKAYCYLDIEGLGAPLKVGGSIDRLDVVEEEGERVLRVIDFKTGHYDSKKIEVKDLDAAFSNRDHGYFRQALIYCLAAVSDPNVSSKLGHYDRLTARLLFTQKDLVEFDSQLKINKIPITNVDTALQADIRSRLQTLVREVLTEQEFPMTAQSNCANCPFGDLCHRDTTAHY